MLSICCLPTLVDSKQLKIVQISWLSTNGTSNFLYDQSSCLVEVMLFEVNIGLCASHDMNGHVWRFFL
jgi:hypothetical protein